jgi:hypothetical protein
MSIPLLLWVMWQHVMYLCVRCFQCREVCGLALPAGLHPAPGSTRSPNCINCTNADVRLRTPDDGQKDCPKHRVVIPIKLELSASAGFIHKKSTTMHGHTILKVSCIYRESYHDSLSIRHLALQLLCNFITKHLITKDLNPLTRTCLSTDSIQPWLCFGKNLCFWELHIVT